MEKTVYFRAFEPEDAELIYKWMNDDELKKMSVGVNRRMCHEEALEWVLTRKKDKRDQVWWGICDVNTNQMIGYTFLSNIHYINRSVEYGGIVIGDRNFQDGFAWIETYLFVMDYVFNRLNLNRMYGYYLFEHKLTNVMMQALFFHQDGVLRQAFFKNGKYNDAKVVSLLSAEYQIHCQNGDYSQSAIAKRVVKLRRNELIL